LFRACAGGDKAARGASTARRRTPMSIHRPTALLALLLATAACGGAGAPTGPSGAAQTVVDRHEITLAAPGESAVLAASVDGQPAAPALRLSAERRWLHDVPVLDPVALAEGRIVGAGPGTAELAVSAAGAAPATVTVRVAPARPLAMSASAAGDTVVVRGFALDRAVATTIRVGGKAARIVYADSATLRAVAAEGAEGCVSGSRPETVEVSGADAAGPLAVRRARQGELALAVGVPVRLDAARARCLMLAPAAGARYALAFLDPRRVRAAELGPEGAAPTSTHYTASIAEAGNAAPSLTHLAPSASATLRAPRTSSAAAGTPATRTAPWAEGDRFVLREAGAAPVQVRVVRVYGGHLVFALAEGEEPAGGAEAWAARADSAFRMLVEHGYPLFERALTPNRPSSSAGAGQLLVVARRETSAYLGATVTVQDDGRGYPYVLANSAYAFSATGLLRTLAHEVTHAWQMAWAAETRPAGTLGTGAPAWAVEGNADLLAWGTLRRALGIGAAENWEWAGRMTDAAVAPYALLAAGARGDLTAGYASSASFQADLALRLVQGGMDEADALAEVSRGVLEGWHGWDPAGARRTGLSGRMRARLGAAWAPETALLGWALSQAADDLTANPALQNPAFARVSTAAGDAGLGWLPAATLRSGGVAGRADPAAQASLAGNAATVAARYGSPGYVLIDDDGFGGAYTLTASAGGASLDAAWMIVRIR
jgi:hypothetical protein